MRRGLIKQYRKQTANTKALKGKLEFAGNIRRNFIHKERFFTRHQIYDTNHLIHQVLYEAIAIVAYMSQGTRMADYANRIRLAFPQVTVRQFNLSLLDQIQLYRKSSDYAYALELARLIILNYSPDIKGGSHKMLSLLFDMNQLWELYVLKILQKTVHKSKKYQIYKVTGQKKKYFISGHYLQPDVLIENTRNHEVFILDTKWKMPTEKTVSIIDLRQMYVYGRLFKAEKTVLLYPSQDFQNTVFQSFMIKDCGFNHKAEAELMVHKCKTAFVSVVDESGRLSSETAINIFELFN
jgi:5-methylcytosine-specific restriction enzyme subunit McrC